MGAFDLYQHHRIRQTNKRLSIAEEESNRQLRRNRDELRDANERIDRLVLVCQALWELASEATGLDPEALAERVRAIDEADGELDGRRRGTVEQCPCGAKISPQAPICQFCGAPAPNRSIFDQL